MLSANQAYWQQEIGFQMNERHELCAIWDAMWNNMLLFVNSILLSPSLIDVPGFALCPKVRLTDEA